MNTEQERAEFEAWYRLHHGSLDVYGRDASGEYADKQVQGAFNVWQARAALTAQPAALAEPVAAVVREHDGRAFAVLRPAGENLPDGTELYTAQPEPITPKQLARLIADNPDVQFSVKPRPADEELRRDAERMKFAAEAPNLHGQVYLSCRLRGAAHQQALDLAHDAEKMYGPEQVSEADLRIILEEISDAIADEKREG